MGLLSRLPLAEETCRSRRRPCMSRRTLSLGTLGCSTVSVLHSDHPHTVALTLAAATTAVALGTAHCCRGDVYVTPLSAAPRAEFARARMVQAIRSWWATRSSNHVLRPWPSRPAEADPPLQHVGVARRPW